jgi:voltage-gated potassium channel
MEQPDPAPPPLETLVARVMFGLSIVFLLLLAVVLHAPQFTEPPQATESSPLSTELPPQSTEPPRASTESPTEFVEELLRLWEKKEYRYLVLGLALLWPVFAAEAIWRFLRRDRREPLWRAIGFLLLVCLFPPLRIGARNQAGMKPIWLPVLGWREVERDLRRTLERFFSVPMVVIALMVLPLLAIQFGLPNQVESSEALRLFLTVATGVIWVAFAVEFIIKVSIAKNKLQYSLQHWVDLAIIVLPFLMFLPVLRLLRIANILRLEQLTRMSRVYRMQGLALKAWRAVLLLEVVQRLTGQTFEKRLRKLQALQAAKEEELDELRQEIEDLHKRIAQQKQAGAVREADDERP